MHAHVCVYICLCTRERRYICGEGAGGDKLNITHTDTRTRDMHLSWVGVRKMSADCYCCWWC